MTVSWRTSVRAAVVAFWRKRDNVSAIEARGERFPGLKDALDPSAPPAVA
jgi:hypothetical protein